MCGIVSRGPIPGSLWISQRALANSLDADAFFDGLQLVVDFAVLELFGDRADAGFEGAEFGFNLVARHPAWPWLVQHAVQLTLGLDGRLDRLNLIFHAPELGERRATDALLAQAVGAAARLGLRGLRGQRALSVLEL